MTGPIPAGAPEAVFHLATIAREPRPAGGPAEARAREYVARVLRDAGFDVHVEPFEYSAFPGRYGTPVGGGVATVAVIAAALVALGSPTGWHGAAVLGAGLALAGLFAWHMLGDAVLDLPFARARGDNLVATRGSGAPAIWIVAHLDSKSQPIPSAARVAGIALLGAGCLAALVAAVLQLAGYPHRTGWWAAALLAAAGGPLVMASVVGTRSDGAVDNASGVATVLVAAARVRPEVALGVLVPSAEELGLAGARAWARAWSGRHPAGTAINCDGVDDEGSLTIMYSAGVEAGFLDILRHASPTPLVVRRMPLGLLTDSVALAGRGWRTATVSRGGWATLARVHSRRDSLDSLTGRGIDDAATLIARAVEALA